VWGRYVRQVVVPARPVHRRVHRCSQVLSTSRPAFMNPPVRLLRPARGSVRVTVAAQRTRVACRWRGGPGIAKGAVCRVAGRLGVLVGGSCAEVLRVVCHGECV